MSDIDWPRLEEVERNCDRGVDIPALVAAQLCASIRRLATELRVSHSCENQAAAPSAPQASSLADFWIVVTQYDRDAAGPFRGAEEPGGPLVHEGFLLSEEQARERAKSLSRYGWVRYMRVTKAMQGD